MRSKTSRNKTQLAATYILSFIAIISIYLLIFKENSKEGMQWVSVNSQAFNKNGAAEKANHLIMVAGHSVTISGHLQDAGIDESDWFLLPYQKGKGLPQTIVGHIREGIKIAANDPNSLLIFSGGETRESTGPINEGTSYFRVADAMHLWEEGFAAGKNVRARTLSEEFATDSYQNLLFSICRFKEITGRYPEKITTVSFTFKKRRFESMHALALLWPVDKFFYVGVDPDPSTGFNLSEAKKGEQDNAAKPFEGDPYGCHTNVLIEKRKGRNPFHRTPPYELTCPEMKELLQWCGPEIIPEGKVPWSDAFEFLEKQSDMKLLGMLNRKERSDCTSKSSPFKKSKQRQSSRHHANLHSIPSLCEPSANSVVSIPLGNNDDNTIVGSNTLNEWSVADNAPSFGSAGEIFLSEEQRRWSEMRRNHVGNTIKNTKVSSSDEEHKNEDDESQNLQFLHCKLSDSPTRCKQDLEKQKDPNATPVRKTSNRGNHLISEIVSEKLQSPNNIKSRVKGFCTGPLSCPISLNATASMLTEGSSGPIDVDDLTEERQFDNINATDGAKKNEHLYSKNCLSIELKGRIHAAYDDENEIVDNSYDEFCPADSPSTVGSIDCSSMKNVGNENSPLHSTDKPTNQRIKTNSTRNNENETTFNMIRKQIHDAEPEFTFSISEEDIFASDDSDLITSTAWLLNDNDCGNSNDTSDFRLEDSKSNDGGEDVRGIGLLQRQKTSRTVMTEAAVVGDDDYLNAVSNTRRTNHLASSNGFMKMKSKLKSIVKKASNITNSDSHPEGKVSSQLKKAKMIRNQSEVSLKPLTGIEDNSRILGRFRKDKILAKEMNRRKYIEKLNVQKGQSEQKKPVGKEKLHVSTARRWMNSSGKFNVSKVGTNLGFSVDFSDEETETPQASVPTKHDFSCVICQQNDRTHLSIPCMHFSYCGSCVNEIEIKECPTVTIRCAVCEEEVTKYSKVFY